MGHSTKPRTLEKVPLSQIFDTFVSLWHTFRAIFGSEYPIATNVSKFEKELMISFFWVLENVSILFYRNFQLTKFS